MAFDYDVFFSYRHKPLDGVMTQNTFNAVESYRLPKSLRQKGYADVKRAFRDTEELPVSRILTDTIDKALHSTRCLIIVCSTDTPSSEWVDREVALFIELGRAEHIYPLLISGDPQTSFPPSLKRIPDVMDRVMDVRVPGNNIRQMMAKEETELLKVIADISGCPLPQLQREHKLRKTRQFAAKSAAAAGFCFLVGAVSLGLMNRAQNYRDRAQAAEQRSMRILQELTYELPDKLTGVPGAYAKISDILVENAEQINQILMLSTNRTGAEYEVAANYEKLATAMTVLGDYTAAAEQQHQALALYEKLCSSAEDQDPLASAANNLARIYSKAGRFADAEAYFDMAIKQCSDSQMLAAMLANAGANAVEAGSGRAEEYFAQCAELLSQLPADYDNTLTGANAALSYGALLYRENRYQEAEDQYALAVDGFTGLCRQVDSRQNRNLLLNAVSGQALVLSDTGRYNQAEDLYRQAIALAEELADADNTESLLTLANLYNNCGICCSMRGRFDSALQYYTQAAGQYQALAAVTGSAPDTASYASACMNVADAAYKLAAYDNCSSWMLQGLEAFGSVADRLDDLRLSHYYAWSAYYFLIVENNPSDALNTALAACRLAPESVLTNQVLGYCCLYTGYYDDCDRLLGLVASAAEGQADMIRLDLQAQQRAGLTSEHLPDLLALLG